VKSEKLSQLHGDLLASHAQLWRFVTTIGRNTILRNVGNYLHIDAPYIFLHCEYCDGCHLLQSKDYLESLEVAMTLSRVSRSGYDIV